MARRSPRRFAGFTGLLALVPLLLIGISAQSPKVAATSTQATAGTYTNPLKIQIKDDGLVESCADPAIIRGRGEDTFWYAYCTKDPLNDEDFNNRGELNFRVIPMLRSADLVNWEYMGPAFPSNPDWADPFAGIFAPAIEYFNGKYYLYYSVTNTKLEERGDDQAIGVATSTSPLGPWQDKGSPVVEPHPAPCCPDSRRWAIDPEVIEYQGKRYMFYGSYFGGISVRELSADGLSTLPETQRQIIVDNRYEAPYLVEYGGFWYIFLSATDCCRGPLTGYSVFAGRSESPFGPFVDREGVPLCGGLTDEGPQGSDCQIGQVGGTPVLSMNGNRWVGPGHNAVFQDFDGQYWTLYHAVDRNDPFFPRAPGFGTEPGQGRLTKRPLMLDPLDWVDGWPMVRGGLWASDTPQPAPAAQPGDTNEYVVRTARMDQPGELLAGYSEEFNGETPVTDFVWVRQPPTTTYGLESSGPLSGTLRFNTQDADINRGNNSASVLIGEKDTPGPNFGETPFGDYMVETKVRLDLPPTGCCFNFRQAGMVIYGDDNNYLKLVHFAFFNTRQTEFGKEIFPVPEGTDRYGNTVVGPPNETTWFRIVKRTRGNEQHYQAYTSRDGVTWIRGGVWTHNLGLDARIGLVAMAGSGSVAHFDYVRVYRLQPPPEPQRVYLPLIRR